jgi:uncharacterized protein (TIGR02453 family)
LTFSGFTVADIGFLSALATNNDRDWFAGNRAAYDSGVKPALAALIDATSAACRQRGLAFVSEKGNSAFRIHRDTRFSADKRPYKTHVSATLMDASPHRLRAMVYLHVEPPPPDGGVEPLERPDEPTGHGAFVATGFYFSEREQIDEFRRGIAVDPHAWLAVEAELAARRLALDPGAPVKRIPKGFEDHAGSHIEPALKRTRWVLSRPISAVEVQAPELPDLIADFVSDARPLLEFGWGGGSPA